MKKIGGWNKGLLLKPICPRGHDKKAVGMNTQGVCNQCVKDRDADPTFKKQKRNIRLRREYGITLLQYNEMLKNQKYRCAVCFKQNVLVVDHNHKTGKIRGLLCMSCNVILGSVKEDVTILQSAIKYLGIE